MLLSTARLSGLARSLAEGLAPWRTTRWVHDPGKTWCIRSTTLSTPRLGSDDAVVDLPVTRCSPRICPIRTTRRS
nr:IS1380 family transposase [Actinomycetes bacterium]